MSTGALLLRCLLRRTSTASFWSLCSPPDPNSKLRIECSPPDLNCKLVITAFPGPQLQACDRSVPRRTRTASSGSECSPPDPKKVIYLFSRGNTGSERDVSEMLSEIKPTWAMILTIFPIPQTVCPHWGVLTLVVMADPWSDYHHPPPQQPQRHHPTPHHPPTPPHCLGSLARIFFYMVLIRVLYFSFFSYGVCPFSSLLHFSCVHHCFHPSFTATILTRDLHDMASKKPWIWNGKCFSPNGNACRCTFLIYHPQA